MGATALYAQSGLALERLLANAGLRNAVMGIAIRGCADGKAGREERLQIQQFIGRFNQTRHARLLQADLFEDNGRRKLGRMDQGRGKADREIKR